MKSKVRMPRFTAEASLCQSRGTFMQTYGSSTRLWMVEPAGLLGGIIVGAHCAVCVLGDDLDGSSSFSWGRAIACGVCGIGVAEPL